MRPIIKTYWLPVALLCALCMVPLFVRAPYILHIFIWTFYLATASMAWSILGGMAGQNSLGHACFMGLGAYISTLLILRLSFLPWISLPIAMIVTGVIAMIFFYPCFILKGPYFTLVTIAFSEVVRNFLINWPFANRAGGLLLPLGEDSLAHFRFFSRVPYFYAGIIMLVLVYLFVKKLDKSKIGFALKTIREDEDVASAIGINPTKYKVIAVGISAMITSITGFFYASYLRFIDPDIMFLLYSTEFVLPAIIGGIRFVSGPILGAFIMVPLSEFLRVELGTIPGVNLIVYAIALILIIRFQPLGILGWWYKMREQRALKKKGGTNV